MNKYIFGNDDHPGIEIKIYAENETEAHEVLRILLDDNEHWLHLSSTCEWKIRSSL